MLRRVQLFAWAPALTLLAAFAVVILAMGYGIIGVAFLLLFAGLAGGALMSYIGGD